MGLLAFLPLIGDILDKVLPDKSTSEQAKMKLAELAQQGNLAELNAMVDLTKAQTDTNIAEASSGDRFKGGWRPMIGYVCAASAVLSLRSLLISSRLALNCLTSILDLPSFSCRLE